MCPAIVWATCCFISRRPARPSSATRSLPAASAGPTCRAAVSKCWKNRSGRRSTRSPGARGFFPATARRRRWRRKKSTTLMSTTDHEFFMWRALELARRAWGATHPNPMVGAVIVEDGKAVAEGYHEQDGAPHAERVALQALGRKPKPGAILYVTLEPCSTPGRTGACTEAIIAAGLKHVVAGAADPNPAHAGRGFELLRAAGVEVTTGVLEQECADLNMIFNHWITRGTPFFAAKSAVTLDGRIACRTGDSKWITGEQARSDVMRWRRLFPAIAVGAGTVMKDNPRLTARTGSGEWCPIRFVFDGLLRTVLDRVQPQVYRDEFRERTVVVTTPHSGAGYARKLRAAGVQVWVMPSLTQRVALADFRQ